MLNRTLVAVLFLFAATLSVFSLAVAELPSFQRGTGEKAGIARQGGKGAEIRELRGEIVELVKGKCEKTTGCADIGYHIVVKTDSNPKLNLHLGPYEAVTKLLPSLKVGEQVAFQGFRTKRLDEGSLVAKSLTINKQQVLLRDDSLKPVWGGKKKNR